MKNFKKGLLALTVAATMPLIAAENLQIFVDTLADENGENLKACSLREAIKAAEINKAYGGCSAGKLNSMLVDDIIMKVEGEVKISSPLVIKSDVNIYGKPPEDLSRVHRLTNIYPARSSNKNTINAQGHSIIFDTATHRKVLGLYFFDLKNGKGVRGGAIHAGGLVTLGRVNILDSVATERGGAIFLEGKNSVLDVTNSNFKGNTAPKGAVLDMTCRDSLGYTPHSFNFYSGAIYENGTAESETLIDLCGDVDVDIKSSTIAKNTVSAVNGTILKFTGDSYDPQTDLSRLSTSSNLSLLNNTIVENSGRRTFLYDAIAPKQVNSNVLAYNQNKSCEYLLGNVADKENVNLYLNSNAIQWGANASSPCDVPDSLLPAEKNTNKNLAGVSIASVLSTIQQPSEITDFKALYYPINNKATYSLVDVEARTCDDVDQRGLSRIVSGTLVFDADNVNSCDIGAVELQKLTAADITGVSNQSQTLYEDYYQQDADRFKEYYEDEEEFLDAKAYYKTQSDLFKSQLEYLKANRLYRASYVDIFSLVQPHEYTTVTNNTADLKLLNSENYTVEAVAIGTGPDTIETKLNPEQVALPDPKLVCRWDNTLKRVVIYRTDDQLSQAGDYSYCKYTIKLKTDPNQQSVGLIQTTFKNYEPVPMNDEYHIRYGGEHRIKVNLLENDSDDQDGFANSSNYPANKSQFYTNEDGVMTPVLLSGVPSSLEVIPEASGPCPDDQTKTCVSGNIEIRYKNQFDKFNYDFTYKIYDADGKQSNSATVNIINSATTKDDTRSSGGSFGLLGLLGLVVLAGWRQRKYK